MKRRYLSLFALIAIVISSLFSCSDDSGEFTHCELTLVLDESFQAEESEDFDLLISNGETAVSVIRITFEAGFDSGISDTYTAKGFAAFFMNKNGKSDTLLMHEHVPYYTYKETVNGSELFYTVTFYRSYNAYFVVTYATRAQNEQLLSDKFLQYAASAYFNDAPTITTK